MVALCQLAEAATALFLAWSTYAGTLNEVQIFVATFVLGIAGAFESPALSALLPQIAPTGSLQRATAHIERCGPGCDHHRPRTRRSRLCGRAQSSLRNHRRVLRACRAPDESHSSGTAGCPSRITPRRTISSPAIRFIRSDPAILGTISLDLFAVLFGGVVALLPIYARDILQTGPFGLGVLRAAPAVGALLTTIVLARHAISRRVGMRMFQSVIIFGVATVVFALSHWMWLSLIALAVARRRRHGERGDPLLAGAAAHAGLRCAAGSGR